MTDHESWIAMTSMIVSPRHELCETVSAACERSVLYAEAAHAPSRPLFHIVAARYPQQRRASRQVTANHQSNATHQGPDPAQPQSLQRPERTRALTSAITFEATTNHNLRNKHATVHADLSLLFRYHRHFIPFVRTNPTTLVTRPLVYGLHPSLPEPIQPDPPHPKPCIQSRKCTPRP